MITKITFRRTLNERFKPRLSYLLSAHIKDIKCVGAKTKSKIYLKHFRVHMTYYRSPPCR